LDPGESLRAGRVQVLRSEHETEYGGRNETDGYTVSGLSSFPVERMLSTPDMDTTIHEPGHREPRERAHLKPVDAPVEVLVFDPLSTPLAKAAARFLSPLVITAAAFAARMAAVALFTTGNGKWGAAFAFVGFVLDATDGKVARIRRQTMHLHETLDFVLDQVAFSAMAVGLIAGELDGGSDSTATAVAAFLATYTVALSLGGTRFRLVGELGLNWREHQVVNRLLQRGEAASGTEGTLLRLHAANARLQAFAGRWRILPRPTAIEGLVLIFVVAPLLGTPLWTVVLAAIVLVPDLLVNAASVVFLARAQDP
jgi:phosphatidylglycerophosphate synthase